MKSRKLARRLALARGPARANRRLALAGAFAALFGALLALDACNTPFIPLPPPGDPTFEPVVTPDGMGGTRMLWQAQGQPNMALSDARVYVWNASVRAGVITQAKPDGSYVAGPFDGSRNDRIEIRYDSSKGERSPNICRLLEPGLARTPCP